MPRTIARKKVMDAQDVAQNATGYSDIFDFSKCTGDSGVEFISTAGSVTITQQVSYDKVHWYDATDSSDSAVGSVVATATVTAGRWIACTPVLAPYARFKVVETNVAATKVSITVIFQEDN